MSLPLQVSGVGYNGAGTVCLLPTREILKAFSNVSVGKLVEVSGGLLWAESGCGRPRGLAEVWASHDRFSLHAPFSRSLTPTPSFNHVPQNPPGPGVRLHPPEARLQPGARVLTQTGKNPQRVTQRWWLRDSTGHSEPECGAGGRGRKVLSKRLIWGPAVKLKGLTPGSGAFCCVP